MRWKSIILLLGIFAISVLIRLPNLDRPLSKHHEFCTAVALQVISIWDEGGIANYHYAPSLTYPGEVNKGINNWASPTGNLRDDSGKYYYISHPPLAYFIPYLLFEMTGSAPSAFGLQIINLIAHFFSAFGVFLIARLFMSRPVVPILAFVLYVFTPSSLWFQSNVYMSDMLVMPFFIFAVYFLLRYRRSSSKAHLVCFLLMLAIAIYTSWLGAFLAFVVFLFGLRKADRDLRLSLLTAITTLIVLLGILLHYAAIAGWENLVDTLGHRLSQRGALGGNDPGFLAWIKMVGLLFYNHATGYTVLILLLLFGFLKFRKDLQSDVRWKEIIRFAGLPVLLLNIALLNYAGHDFVALYSGMFIVLAIGLGLERAHLDAKPIIGVITMIVVLQVTTYYVINRTGEYSQNGERYDQYKVLAEGIRSHAGKDQLIFLKDLYPEPQTIVYLGQNVQTVKDLKEAREIAAERNSRNSVYLYLSKDHQLLERVVIP